MKKGRHRRFQEARDLKRGFESMAEPCAECGAEPGEEHASWCLAMEDDELDEDQDQPEHQPEHAAPARGAVPGDGLP